MMNRGNRWRKPRISIAVMRWFSGIYRALIPIHSLKFYSVRGALEVCLDDVPVGKAVIEKGQKETHRSLIQLHHVPNLPRKEAGYEVRLY